MPLAVARLLAIATAGGGLAVLEVSPRLGLDRELHPAASMSHRLPLDSANIKPRS